MEPKSKRRRVPMLSDQLTWSSVVGNFILEFGTLEYDIFVFLSEHATSDELEKARTLHFKDRMDTVASCLTRAGLLLNEEEGFSRFVAELDSVREMRNFIAHGYFGSVKEEGKDLEITISRPRDFDRPFEPETRRIGFDELMDTLQRLYKVTEEFGRLTKRRKGGNPQHFTLMGEGPDQYWAKTPQAPPDESS